MTSTPTNSATLDAAPAAQASAPVIASHPHYSPQFPIEDGKLVVGGRTLEEIASIVGQTPFYAYSSQVIKDRIALLRRTFPKALHLHYAMKANPMPQLVSLIAPLVDGLDVASRRELVVALSTGTAPDTISFAGPGKSDDELAAAVAANVTVNAESPSEVHRLLEQAEQQGRRARVAIRVNPDFELKTSGMKMAGGPKPFGIDAELVPQVLSMLSSANADFVGFHIFSGSQNLSAESLIDAQNQTIELALRLTEFAPNAPDHINIGGGLGIPYFPNEQPLVLDAIAENLDRLLDRSKSILGATQIVMELGRFIVGEAGVYVARVIDKKESRGSTYLVTNGGLHHHLAASGNFGQIIRKNYPVALADRFGEPSDTKANVVGPLCTPLDILADKVALPAGAVGDLVAVFQSGAYGPTASPQQFLSHATAAEILLP